MKPSPCRLCGNIDLIFLFSSKGFSLYRCSACTYVQINCKPSQEEINDIYDTCYFISNKYKDASALELENVRRLNLLKQLMPKKGALVLDAGCATGDFLHHAKNDYEMYGCDISSFAVDLAREKNPDLADNIFIANLDVDTLQSVKFDAICLWDVIEHLWDPVSVCTSFARLLKPGGYIFASTPDIGSLTARLMKSRWAFMTPPEHMGFFNADSFAYLFGQNLPFSIVYRKAFGKWTNLGFLVYKLKRIFPAIVPNHVNRIFNRPAISKIRVYVPTHDIQYIAARKST